MDRRTFLLALGALPAGVAAIGGAGAHAETPPSRDLEAIDLALAGDPRVARRALLLVPKHPGARPLRLLVLLHGLGETGDEVRGIHAWGELYGLVPSYERLRRASVAPDDVPDGRYLTAERRAALNGDLAKRPFEGFAVACPVTPNPARPGAPAGTLDRYADWIESALLPAVRARAPILDRAAGLGIDGCSLGGWVALQVFLRKPHLFGAVGGVQAAIGSDVSSWLAERLAATVRRVGPRRIHLETSTGDVYRKANEALSRRLSELGLPNDLLVPPGPHDQPWLREVGTLEMLLWHDRNLLCGSET